MAYEVEVKKDVFEEVRAEGLQINAGTLIFTNDEDELVVAYAQGQWLTVIPEAQ